VWWEALADLRARYGRIVNARPGEVALAPSISVALSTVAESLDYKRRPRVVITSLDFPTVAYQWLAKAPQGVELVVVESPDKISVPVEAIARAVDDRTALVATSHVYFTSGAIQDIKRVAEFAHAHGAGVSHRCIPIGRQIPVDVQHAAWTRSSPAASSGCWRAGDRLPVHEGGACAAARAGHRRWFGQRDQLPSIPEG